MAHAGTFVSPTVNTGWGARLSKAASAGDAAGLSDNRREPTPFAECMQDVFAALRAAGVPLIASTDAGIPGVVHDHLAQALPVFAHYAQLSAVEVLRSATSESAVALGIDDETGALAPGLAADILVVPGDPLQDLSVLSTPMNVVARGAAISRGNS